MTHFDEGHIQAYLDGDLDVAARSGVEEHLAGCPHCAAQLEELRAAAGLFASAVRLLDEPQRMAAARSAAGRSLRAPSGRVQPLRQPFFAGSLARAAILILGLAAAASASLPGSPVREWIVTTWDRLASGFGSESPLALPEPAADAAPAAPAVPAARPTPVAGVSVRASGNAVEVAITGNDAPIRVRLIDGERAVVQASGGAASANFQTAPGRVAMTGGASSGEILVDFPRSVQRASLLVDGALYLSKQGDDVRLDGPAAEDTGSEYIFPGRP